MRDAIVGAPARRDTVGMRAPRQFPALLVLATGLAVASCFGGETTALGDNTCKATSRYPGATGCAFVTGTISDTLGARLDSISGLLRLDDACVCSMPTLEGDENGVYNSVVHRLPRPGGFVDTATATVVALASAPKYPRHVTGAAYFDTLRVVLRFVRIGQVPQPTEVNLRIPLPGR